MTTVTESKHYAKMGATLDELVPLIRKKRAREKLSLRQAADQIGIPFSTLNNIEYGVSPRLVTVRAILDWLGA